MDNVGFSALSFNTGRFANGSFGLLCTGALTRIIDTHIAGHKDEGHRLYTLLMLELWHREFIDRVPTTL